MKQSPSFGDLVATVETLDRLVYIEEGRCGDSEFRACLHIVRAPDSRIVLIKIDPRQQLGRSSCSLRTNSTTRSKWLENQRS